MNKEYEEAIKALLKDNQGLFPVALKLLFDVYRNNNCLCPDCFDLYEWREEHLRQFFEILGILKLDGTLKDLVGCDNCNHKWFVQNWGEVVCCPKCKSEYIIIIEEFRQ